MIVDLNDPQSIVAWYRVWPERHGLQLAWMATAWPAFAPAIKAAWELVDG